MKAGYLMLYRDYSHWWQRVWDWLRGRSPVVWEGNVRPLDDFDLDQDSVTFIVDASGTFHIVDKP